MAFDKTPDTHITGIDIKSGGDSLAGAGTDKYLIIPITSIPELEVSEVQGGTGDIRRVIYALCRKFTDIYQAMALADRPTKWLTSFSTTVDGPNAGVATQHFNTRFDVNVGGFEVADEA